MLVANKAKELLLVLKSFRPEGQRWKVLAAAAAVVIGTGAARAQTAPQLLPYTAKLIAGGGTTAKFTVGQACPSSGLTVLDTYGDGCLATELALTAPRYATADQAGNVFFSDYTNGLIRRVDATSGVVNLVAGSVYTSPTAGASCGTGSTTTSTDAKGDGCLGVQVNVYRPVGLVFSPSGDLYFSEFGNSDVRKIASTGGVVPQSTVNGAVVYTGTISLVAGSASSTYGYASNFGSTTINAATQGYLDGPYELSFDASGNLYIAEEYKNAILVVNTNATGSTTVAGVTIPAGTISKIAGATSSGSSTCPNSPASPNGCNYGTYVSGAAANSSETDSPFGVTVDLNGVTYFANTYTRSVAAVSTAGVLTNYAGVLNTTGKTLTRAQAGSFAIGDVFSVAADASSNVYLTDPVNGVVWRVDGTANHPMYVVAGGAATVCASHSDAYGDGCPATQAMFGSTASPSSPTAALGVYGVSVDAHSDLFLGDSATNLIREIASGTQFGSVGTATTDTLDIHFAQGDLPGANPYTLTSGSSNFTLGAATCTTNSDATTDCLLPVTAVAATSANLGAFSGTLQVTSVNGGLGTFALSGTHVQSPVTRVAVTVVNASCSGATSVGPTTAVTLTATIVSTGSPTGTIQFYANGNAIGTPAAVSSSTASITYTFATAGTYAITAQYSGDSYFQSSTSTASSASTLTSSKPTFSATLAEAPNGNSVVQGQTATYSFTLAQTVYTGTVTFSVAGLPANASAVFSPVSIAASGCSTSNTVAMSILTSLAPVKQAGLGGRGTGRLLLALASVLLLGVAATKRRRLRGLPVQLCLLFAMLAAGIGLQGCGIGAQSGVSTPVGSYNLTVTATGSDGTTSTVATTLNVTAYVDPYH